MKIRELQEARGALGPNTHSILMRNREKRATEKHTAKLVRLKKDGAESGMHDATSTYPTEAAARAKHTDWVKLNPGRDIRHNLYVDGKLVQVLDPTTLTEVSYKVGAAAGKALTAKSITPEEQQKHVQKFQELQAQEQELMARPDSSTGKYAKHLMNLNRKKVEVARAGKLNAFGEPMLEYASSSSTSSVSIASEANPLGAVMRRPSLFGYVPSKIKRKSTKSK